jgi:hypothetical protein
MDAPAAAAPASAIEYKRSGPCVGIVYDERMLLHSVHSGAVAGGASSGESESGESGGESGSSGGSAAVNASGVTVPRSNTTASTGGTTPVTLRAAADDESSPGDHDADDAASIDSEFPYGHPECPQRIVSIFEAIKNAGLLKSCRLVQAEPISYDLIATVHDAEYIRHMKENDGRDRDELEEELEDNKCTFGTEFHEHDPGDWNGGSVYVCECCAWSCASGQCAVSACRSHQTPVTTAATTNGWQTFSRRSRGGGFRIAYCVVVVVVVRALKLRVARWWWWWWVRASPAGT